MLISLSTLSRFDLGSVTDDQLTLKILKGREIGSVFILSAQRRPTGMKHRMVPCHVIGLRMGRSELISAKISLTGR